MKPINWVIHVSPVCPERFPSFHCPAPISCDLIGSAPRTLKNNMEALLCTAAASLPSLSSSCLISILLRDRPIHKRGCREVGQASWTDKTSPRSAFTTTARRHNGGNRTWARPSVALVQPRQPNNAMHCNSLSFVNAQEALWDCSRLTHTVSEYE